MKFLWLILAFMVHGCACPGLAWNQVSSKVVQVDQASGVSSTPNYWKTGDAEVLLTGVAAYNDGASAKPVDCTGGSSTMTGVRNATNPMYDKFSWLVSKPAGNMQGQGIAFEFDVDNAVAGVQAMDLLFDYMLEFGTFTAGDKDTNSDLMFYLYDVTAGQLIEPKGGSKLFTSSTTVNGEYRGWFQSTLGSKKYRVCLHQATTSASAYGMKVDAGKVQKSKQVVGTIITDWQSYTPTVTGLGSGSYATQVARYRRVGDSIEIHVSLIKDTTPGTGSTAVTISSPSGLSFSTGSPSFGIGSGWYNDGVQTYHSTAINNTASTITIRKATTLVSVVGSDLLANASFGIHVSVPIQGWSAGARMSDGYDGRVVSAYGLMTSQQTGVNPNNTQVKIQINALGATALDTVAGFDFANNRYIFKSGGSYTIGAGIEMLGTNVLASTYVGRVLLTRAAGGSTTYAFDLFQSPANTPFSLRGDLKVNVSAGDYIELYLFGLGNNSSSTLTVSNSSITHLSISKDSGTPFMSPTALWETHYAGTAGDAIGTSDSLIKFTTKVEDTFGSYNPATGLWTAKGPATCSTDARVQGVSVNMSTTQSFGSALRKDGAAINNGTIMYGAGVSRVPSSIISVSSIKVVQGTTLSVYAYSDVATTASTSQTSNYFTVSCRQ